MLTLPALPFFFPLVIGRQIGNARMMRYVDERVVLALVGKAPQEHRYITHTHMLRKPFSAAGAADRVGACKSRLPK